jgi:hypothetical protein
VPPWRVAGQLYFFTFIYIHTYHTNGVCFALEVTEDFIHHLSEADWLTRARDSKCAEASKIRPPSFVSVTLNLGIPKWPLPFRFSEQNPACIYFLSNSCYLPSPHRHTDQKYCTVQTPQIAALTVCFNQSCPGWTSLRSHANVWGRFWFPNQNVVSAGAADAGGWGWLWLQAAVSCPR